MKNLFEVATVQEVEQGMEIKSRREY